MHSQVRLWTQHPVTERLLKLIKEHRDGHVERLLNRVSFTADQLGECSELKGYINFADTILDVDSFFEGEYEDESLSSN